MSDKLHSLTVVVPERVSAELLLNRVRPGAALWSWSLLCAEDSEYCCGCMPPTAWSKQSEVPYRVPIAFGDVLRPAVDELLDRALLRGSSMSALVPIPEQYKSILDRKDAPLRDGRTPRIAPGVAQEVLFLVEGLHMSYPMALLLALEQTFHLIVSSSKLAALWFDTSVIMRAGDDSQLVNEFVRSFLRKYAPQRLLPKQMELWLSA